MHLKCKDWRRFRRKPRLQTWPNGQVMAIFGRSPKTRIFWKKAKGRPRETFKKSPKKYPLLQRAKSTLPKMSLTYNLYPLILQRLEKILAHKAALRLPEWASYGYFCKVTLNPHFLKKCKGGVQEKCFKIRLKSSPRLNGPKAHWRKWHYPLSSTHLKCKDWRTFWFKQRLQKLPNGQVMGIFAKSFKTRIFWKKKENQKSPKKMSSP